MKFDKETMLKHQFWFLLALAVPLTLGAYFFLMTAVRGAINKDRKDLEDKLKSASSATRIMNQKSVDIMEDKAKKMAAKEETVWKEAYGSQINISTWPEAIEKEFDFKDGYFATEIKAERSKDKQDKATGKFPANDGSHFHGVVTSCDQNQVTVAGEKGPPIKFQATPKVKVTGDKGIAYFVNLKEGDRVAVTYVRSKYFWDRLTDFERDKYVEAYKSQIPEILEQVKPVTANGGGVVQLHNWAYKRDTFPPANAQFFHYVAKDWITNYDFSDECWMAQEDLWVQREIYRIIREANDSVSNFKVKGKGGDAKPNAPQVYTFTNPYWQLTIELAGKKKLGITIKNQLPWRQRLDLDFLFQLQKNANHDQYEKVTVGGEPLDPHESRELKVHDVQGQAATGIYHVEQVINWETAAVKRIDHISFGSLASGDCAHGHRTFPDGLKPFQEKKEAAPQQGPGPGGLDPKMKMIDKDMMKGKGKGDTAANISPNGLRIDRYNEKPTKQSRRIPIGVALIVDQEHVDRVLLAFSKSRLRFLTTQVILNRYPHSVRPEFGETQPGNKGFNPKDFFKGGEAAAGQGFGGFRNQPRTVSSSSTDQESNMELVVYGVVTLYERYPPRKTP